MYRIAGDKRQAEKLEVKRDNLAKNLILYLYDNKKHLFVDYLGSENTPYHASPMAMAFGLPLPDGYRAIKDQIECEGLRCGVYFAYFVIQGLYNAGYNDLAYRLITSHAEYSWYSMLEAGATTCMEVWKPDMKSNTSWCHPWSSSPIIFISENTMGLSPATPTWRSIYFKPRPPISLDSSKLTMNTPNGSITVSYFKDSHTTHYILELENTGYFILEFKDILPDITIDNVDIELSKGKDEIKSQLLRHEITLSKGIHTISTYSLPSALAFGGC